MPARSKTQTKSAKVIASLSRTKGATLEEICKTTNWQQHSVRAFLTGLRKKGYVLTREQRGEDSTAYRIIQSSSHQEPESAA